MAIVGIEGGIFGAALEAKMCEAVEATLKTALQYHVTMRTAAYLVAINRIATVTKMRGMYA